MDIFIDTEFTGLTRDAQLLSFGAISEDEREFYVELHPLPEIGCSEFVREHVLPLFEGGPARCPRPAFGQRLAGWLRSFDAPRLIADSDWDAYVLRYALTGEYSRADGRLEFPGSDGLSATLLILPALRAGAAQALAKGMAAHFAQDSRQHHALVDARALRQGVSTMRTHLETGA